MKRLMDTIKEAILSRMSVHVVQISEDYNTDYELFSSNEKAQEYIDKYIQKGIDHGIYESIDDVSEYTTISILVRGVNDKL